jgi:hypothetical protein
MKSPRQLADQLVRQWQQADWREQQLLHNPAAWPLRLAIGEPGAQNVRDDAAALRQHLQQWRTIAERGPGQVDWTPRQYRSAAAPVEVPTHWVLQPSDCVQAFERCAGSEGAQAAADYRALAAVLGQVDPCFHPLLLRRLALWRGVLPAQLVTSTQVALRLAPGCADGRPLRALSVAGNDSKFFERHASLLAALLDARFDGEASRQGLAAFLGAAQEGEHWLLVVPLAEGLLPFKRQRVTASELQTTALPAGRILLVENERCLHQLTAPVPDTVAILGAGLNLGWLSAPWLQSRQVAYWGDIDTWGLAMLATARSHLPQLQALLMDAACFASHQHLAVAEPVRADAPACGVLLPNEAALDRHLRTLTAGRLEQEFLPVAAVRAAMEEWMQQSVGSQGRG